MRIASQSFASHIAAIIATIFLCTGQVSHGADDAAPQIQVSISDDGHHAEFTDGEQVVLKYRSTNDSPKQYVEQLTIPGGIDLLDDAPADHPWHHGLMLALTLNGVNYWSEALPNDPKSATGLGLQRTASTLSTGRLGKQNSLPAIFDTIDWIDDKENLQLQERRTVALREAPHQAEALLTWRSELTVPANARALELTGAHYHGVGLRFAPQFTDNTQLLLPDGTDAAKDGQTVRGTEVLYDTPWCAYQSRVNDGDVTVAMFAAPEAGDRPVTWFTMYSPFTYLSATLRLHEQPLHLAPGQKLVLTCGLAVWNRRVDAHQVSLAFDEWHDQLQDLQP